MPNTNQPAIWFPTVKTNTGTDRFTETLVENLNKQGIQAEISWLPPHAEYMPCIVKKITPPNWANIVHINSWLHPKFYPKYLPIIATVHLCVQDPAYVQYKTLAQKIYHQFWITPIEKKCFSSVNFITSVSQYTAKSVEDIFNIKGVKVIYNGINTNIFHEYKQNSTNNKTFRLLFVGTNSIRKGFDLLPQIMEQLGDGFELLYTNTNPKNLILHKNMKPLPYLNSTELAQLYSSVDALIFPSRLEGFGLVVAEAMACGLPVIIADSSALTELVDHNITGFLCEKDNINDFVQTIQNLKNNPQICKTIGTRARDISTKKFNISNMVEEYKKLYTKICLSQK